MLLLMTKAHPSIVALRARVGPTIGRLHTPRCYGEVGPYPWALDNDAFSGFDPARYMAMLERLRPDAPSALFAVVPDVVEDHEETCYLWERWAPYVSGMGYRAAFVLQDGATDFYDVPHDAGALFVGGSTGFKLGEVAERIVGEARRRGMWVHMGRVNTVRRLRYAASIGVCSVDGSGWSRFTATWTHLLYDLEAEQTRIAL